MTRKSTKNVSQGKGYALLRLRSGRLTCSELDVDNVLSAGESTKDERISPVEPAASLHSTSNE
jgi:hypothetical protein